MQIVFTFHLNSVPSLELWKTMCWNTQIHLLYAYSKQILYIMYLVYLTKAYFLAADRVNPIYGNLQSLCAERERGENASVYCCTLNVYTWLPHS